MESADLRPSDQRATSAMLGLVTCFTAGVQEVRAWAIKRGTKAPGAGVEVSTSRIQDRLKDHDQ